MTINSESCMDWILAKVPGFEAKWLKHLAWWGDETPTLGNSISAFSDYVIELANTGDDHDRLAVFQVIEQLYTDGNEEVQTAVATNCLENIVNRSAWGAIPPGLFVPYLGPKSREYCVAWDRFWGATTPGLSDKAP